MHLVVGSYVLLSSPDYSSILPDELLPKFKVSRICQLTGDEQLASVDKTQCVLHVFCDTWQKVNIIFLAFLLFLFKFLF